MLCPLISIHFVFCPMMGAHEYGDYEENAEIGVPYNTYTSDDMTCVVDHLWFLFTEI